MRRRAATTILAARLLLLGSAVAASPRADEFSADALDFFERKIRPLLADNCHKCHGQEKQKSGLRLDSRAAILAGGEGGKAVVPGHPEMSRLVTAVSYTDADLQMPPKKKLSDRQIADLRQWVKLGAPWPGADSSPLAVSPPSSVFAVTEQRRAWWSFQPIHRPVVPPVNRKSQIANPIDAFVLAELEAKDLAPNPPASKRELIRRVYFDLIGLPPPAEAAVAFEEDISPDAFEKVIDHLLSLPQYGERWGRHWLDVVRFAQSNGYERDGEKPLAWRYRDYVVKAFNEDKPYDRFILEQLAGDELDPVTPDSITATGFYRLGVWDDEPDDKRMAIFDELDDIMITTGAAFLGLTLGCARCHDHKFDPIPQADYYQLLAFFRGVRPADRADYTLGAASYAPLAAPSEIKRWQAIQHEKIKPLEEQCAAATTSEDKKKLKEQIAKLQAEKPPFEWALAVKERAGRPEATHLLIRGNAGAPGAEVQPAFLAVLGGQKPKLPAPSSEALSSGRRRALAEWIVRPDNPLPARVMVNRIWRQHFGQGLLKTTSDFGHAGALPTNPRLLDWLADEFIGSGWSMKRLHKLILLSNTYRQSSRAQNAKALAVDPGNDLLWRQNLRRLEAETIRDTMLSITGRLNLKMGGRGFFPELSGEVLAGQSRPGLDWEVNAEDERSRRSLYAYVRRTMPVPMLENFDYSNTATPLGERPITTVAPQALLLLNDEFMQTQAAAFSSRLRGGAGDTADQRIARGYQLALGRPPTRRELKTAVGYLQRQQDKFEELRSRLTFRPAVPTSLSVEYMKQLAPTHFLDGPREGWSYHRGTWSGAYEGIRTVERGRGPFALWTAERFADGVVKARVTLHRASESAALLVRATAAKDELRGYEIVFDPRQQRVAVRRHATEIVTLAEAGAEIPTAQSFAVKIQTAGPRLRVWLHGHGEPALDVTDDKPLAEPGFVGVRTWGAALSVDDLNLGFGGHRISIAPADTASPADRALQAFCLLLLNLNEVIYVD